MDLATYTAERGRAAKLARALNVSPVLISQWASGSRPVPEDRGPAIEWNTDFMVSAEEVCPNTRWCRVPDPAWPNGKPLIDKTPPVQADAVAAPAQAERAAAYTGPERRTSDDDRDWILVPKRRATDKPCAKREQGRAE